VNCTVQPNCANAPLSIYSLTHCALVQQASRDILASVV